MAGRADPGAAVHVDADIPLGRHAWLAGVDAHTHSHGTRRKRALCRVRRGDRVARSCERDEEGITLRVHLDAPVLGHSAAQRSPMLGEDLRIAITQLLECSRRPFDICEEEGHDTGRQRGHSGHLTRPSK